MWCRSKPGHRCRPLPTFPQVQPPSLALFFLLAFSPCYLSRLCEEQSMMAFACALRAHNMSTTSLHLLYSLVSTVTETPLLECWIFMVQPTDSVLRAIPLHCCSVLSLRYPQLFSLSFTMIACLAAFRQRHDAWAGQVSLLHPRSRSCTAQSERGSAHLSNQGKVQRHR